MSGKGNKTYYTPKVPMKIIKITRVNDGKIIKVYSPKSKKLLGTVKIPNEGKGRRTKKRKYKNFEKIWKKIQLQKFNCQTFKKKK